MFNINLDNQPKEIMLYKNGQYINTFKTIKEVCKYCNITNATFNNYNYGNFKNRNGYTFKYKNKKYQRIVDNYLKAKEVYKNLEHKRELANIRLKKIRNSKLYKEKQQEIINKLLDFAVIKKFQKQRYYSSRLSRRYCIITLQKALNIFEDENSNIFSFKDFTLFDEVDL